MNKSYMVILAVIVLVLLGVMFSRFSNNATSNTDNNQQVTNTPTTSSISSESSSSSQTSSQNEIATAIEYTAGGFTPSTVTIKKGQTVKWTNTTDQPMWVASAPHPQHTDYPEFDQLKGVENGESYMFTFGKTGTWKFHNHLNSKDFGKVIVE